MARLKPTPTTIYKLLALSGGICAMPNCGKSLIQEGVFNATLAHIIAASDNGPRGDATVDAETKRHFDNLMFMCPDHGSLIDKKKLGEKYTVDWLRQAKLKHEQKYGNNHYEVPGEVLADALEEIYVHLEQTNTINGDGNTQTNTQIYIAGDHVTDAATKLLKEVNAAPPSHERSDFSGEPDKNTSSKSSEEASEIITPSKPSQTPNTENELPGTIDSVADLETAIPDWTRTMSDLTVEMNSIGELSNGYAAIMQAQNRRGEPASSKIPVLRRFAQELDGPAKRIENLGLQYIEQLNKINPGIYAVVEFSANGTQDDPATIESTYTLLNSVEEMTHSSEYALSTLEGMLTSMRPLENMSKDLRQPLKRIRDGLTFILEGKPIIEGWSELINNARSSLKINKIDPSS